MARRGAAGEVAPQEFGTSMEKGLGHRLLVRALKTFSHPLLTEVRKLLGPCRLAGEKEGAGKRSRRKKEDGQVIGSLD